MGCRARAFVAESGDTAFNYFAYNFIKIHRTLRMTPAMAAGVTDRLWDVADLVALWSSTGGGWKERRKGG
jgi:hypothetical protein